MKTIVLTGGGTGGHVTPNIALIPTLQREGWQVHYIGSHEGIEKQLIAAVKGVTYHAISTGKLRRYFSLKNFSDPFRVLAGISQSKKLMRELKPDLVFAKGGFVSVPVVMAARRHKVPVILHESDYTCGLANRLCLPYADKVCVSFEPTLAHVKGGRGVWTGSPIRNELLHGQKERAQAFCQFDKPGKPWLMFMGGSIGSVALNNAVRSALNELCKEFNVVHLCGKNNRDDAVSNPGYRQYEYISAEMADLYAAADLVVCRSGANTCFELLALKKPAVFVPLPAAQSRGDQILNAEYFQRLGYAHVLPQETITDETLLAAIRRALTQAPSMITAMQDSPISDGTERVLNEIRKYR
ncbi:MAG: undecaprenyldiphospho-muramoylpentapeptide beta-N-acetylglucosaminyltransferase [Clostridia bacterium]|nr:undecaprenyldiphospho-muramoylpentapeptide beta-N-acetylglucosaminyltransferase [Clostridia bacterium]